MAAISVIRETFFADQGLSDNRQALFSFEIPGIEGEWEFFPPAGGPWKTLATVSSQGGGCSSWFVCLCGMEMYRMRMCL